MTYGELVQPLIDRKDLTREQAAALMSHLMSGEATEAQIGAALLGLRIKGCATHEVAAFVTVLREKATMLRHEWDDLVDTCGTGGGVPSFNLSTGAAIVAAAAGARIAKHGNRSMTGMGSADVLEHLGMRLGGEPEQLLHLLETAGVVFLFAQAHHPAMRHVAKARRELGVRTIFNLLGPLLNPAGARRQLVGVYEPGLIRSIGEVLVELGTERALIVHSQDGLDEISPVAPTEYVRIWEGQITSGTLCPSDFGLESLPPEAIAPGRDVADCAGILREALEDAESPRSKALLPNAAAAIWLAGLEPDLRAATDRAQMAIRTGRATSKLEQLIEETEGE